MDRSRLSGMACLIVTCLFFTVVLFQSGPPADLPDSKSEREAQQVSFDERSASAANLRKHNTSFPSRTTSAAALILDVVDVFTPSMELTFEYGGRAIESGTELTPAEAQAAPEVQLRGLEDNLYTLLLVDPDAPSPDAPTEAQWLHWLVTNIPASGGAAQGDEVVPYNGPTPPIGRHRYVFLLYKQTDRLTIQSPAERNRFKAQVFAQEYKLGDPVGASLFYAAASEAREDGREGGAAQVE